MLRYKKTPRTVLIGLGCVSFLAGLGLIKVGLVIEGWPWLVVVAAFCALCYKRKVLVAVPAVIVAGLLLGLLRGGDMASHLQKYDAHIGQKVEITGVVVDDATYNDKRQIDFRLDTVQLDNRDLPGQIRVTTFSPVSPKRGDTVRATGTLYEGFGNYQAALYFAEAHVETANNTFIDTVRRNFAASVLSNIPEPQASLGLGFLLGIKSQLPDELSDELKALSLTHIVVASGFNLTILIRLTRRIFEKRSAFQSVAVAASLMIAFVSLTGFSPSMSRAALVTSLALWAWYFGRRVHPALLLVTAASITAALNPLYLWGDLGWWLSFLAFAGVMLLAPLLQRRIFGTRTLKVIGQVVLETVAAQITTLPLILCVFGSLSLLALPANVIIVPLIPIAMALTFVAGVVGIGVPVVAGVIAWPATALLTYMTEVVGLMARVPWASIPFAISPAVMVGLYCLMALLGGMLWRKTRLNYLEQSVVE